MPEPPEGTCVYTLTNNYAIPLPLDVLLEGFGVMSRAEFASLPESEKRAYREVALPKFKTLQDAITVKSPGACNSMVLVFLGRVFNKVAPIEQPWLGKDEACSLVKMQQSHIVRLLTGPASDSPIQANLKADRHLTGFNVVPLLEDDHVASNMDGAVSAIADEVEKFFFCLLGVHFVRGQAGHAIGLIREGTKWYILDPNFGLYRYDQRSRFTHALGRLLTSYGVSSYFLFAIAPARDAPTGLSKQLLGRIGNLMYSPDMSASDRLLHSMDSQIETRSQSGRLLANMDKPRSASGALLNNMNRR